MLAHENSEGHAVRRRYYPDDEREKSKFAICGYEKKKREDKKGNWVNPAYLFSANCS